MICSKKDLDLENALEQFCSILVCCWRVLIDETIGNQYLRLRLGISRPLNNNHNISNYVLEDFNDKYPTKKFEVSFLCGAKRLVEGHKFRQEIYKIEDKITIPKKWFYTLKDFDVENFNKGGIGRPDDIWVQKQICYQESMFHIGVENVKYNNWCTEKICDAFATKTVPIYWGCPNLAKFGYDENGIIRFNTKEELLDILNNLTPEKYYEMLPSIEHNYTLVKADTFENNISYFFDELFESNNL